MTSIPIQQRVEYIFLCLKELKYALKIQADDQLSEMERRMGFYAAEKKAEEIVECSTKINQEILLKKAMKSANSYKETFLNLESLNLFSKKILGRLAKTANFRNRLALECMELNKDEIVVEMNEILKLYVDYLKKINTLVETL